ncbi:MAG: hypothetical protein QNK19_05000 [Xanthomonadales bacterium]|nr:hypothetical protein [Xanthomonadales bacterium]
MDIKAQRRAGMRLAIAAKALKTKDAIGDGSSCYEDILNAAIDDVGLDTLTATILESDPEWASQMLQHIPNLGAHRDALLKKAATSPAAALHAFRFASDLGNHQQSLVLAAGSAAVSLGNISAIHLKDSAGFDCKFTMFWINKGQTQPKHSYPNSNEWLFSSVFPLGQSQTMVCRNFALKDAPLEAGDEVWIYVRVMSGNKHNESPLRFTYDPTTVNCAEFVISGTTTDNTVAFSKISAAAPIVKVKISKKEGKDVASCTPDVVVVYRNSDTGVQWQMETADYVFTGIDIDADGKDDFGVATISMEGKVMTVLDSVVDLETFKYCVKYKNTTTGETGSFDPGIKNKD